MKFFKTKPLYNAPRYEITPAMFEKFATLGILKIPRLFSDDNKKIVLLFFRTKLLLFSGRWHIIYCRMMLVTHLKVVLRYRLIITSGECDFF